MVPTPNHPRYRQLVTGEFVHNFKQFSAGMCVSRNQRKVAMNPESTTVNGAIHEVHAFFEKFENILADDLKAIFG